MNNLNYYPQEIFKAYDIRGIVGKNLNKHIFRAIGSAFVKFLNYKNKKILIGKDIRINSEEFSYAFAEGVAKEGGLPYLLGLVSTDEFYYACGTRNLPGAMITASHNPKEYNGIKLVQNGAYPISIDNGLNEIKKISNKYFFSSHVNSPMSNIDRSKIRICSSGRLLLEYSKYLRSLVNLNHLKRSLKVVVDASNGMAGLTVPAVLGSSLLKKLPIQIIPIYFELNGSFPNHQPDPMNKKNLIDLKKAVIKNKAHLGLAFDGDADRCFIIDENGECVDPSIIAALIALREIKAAKSRGEKEYIIINNLIVYEYTSDLVKKSKGTILKTRVGHSFIKELMHKKNALFAGEHSAHYYFRSFFNSDTGILAAMHVISELGKFKNVKLSELSKKYKKYYSSDEINIKVKNINSILEKIKSKFLLKFQNKIVKIDFLDGLSLSFENSLKKEKWWLNVRPSNTEPLIRINIKTQVINKIDKILKLVKSCIN